MNWKNYFLIKYLLSSGNTYAVLPLIWQGSLSLSWFKEASRAVRFCCISHWRAILQIVNRFFSWNKSHSKLWHHSINSLVWSDRNMLLNRNVVNILNWRKKYWFTLKPTCHSSTILCNCKGITLSQNLQ